MQSQPNRIFRMVRVANRVVLMLVVWVEFYTPGNPMYRSHSASRVVSKTDRSSPDLAER
jgi:hypothetical protein